MTMQNLSIATFMGGLTTFLGTAAEILSQHAAWSDFTTPRGIAHLLLLGASFTALVAGALGIQLPFRKAATAPAVATPPPSTPEGPTT